MPSPALAIGGELLRRHRWPLIVLLGYMVVLAAIKLLGLGPVEPITIVPPDGRAAVLVAPLSWGFIYYLGLFAFGFSGDLAGRESIFPPRMFTLPVRTETLVLGPMLVGAATVAILFFAASVLARWPWRIDGPLIWPALLAAALLCWSQALLWMPYGLRGVRVAATVLWLAVVDAIVILAAHYKVSEPLMLAILTPQLPLAFIVARYGVARARRGDVPDWRPMFSGLVRLAERRSGFAGRFRSAAHAQAWYEWRRKGLTLPGLVALVLPFELAILWLGTDAPLLVLEIVVLALITPLIVAWFAAATVNRTDFGAGDSYGVSSFLATRPATSAALVAAKLRMAAGSTLATWLLIFLAVPLALIWSGTWQYVSAFGGRVIDIFGTARAVVLTLLVFVGLFVSTWKQLVHSLYIGLTGRAWLVRSSVVGALLFVVFVGPFAEWVLSNKSVQAKLWAALPQILAVLVAIKMTAAALVASRLARSGLLSDRGLLGGVAAWVVLVFAIYGALGWLFAGPLIPRFFLLLIAILAVPLARVSAAPLAFAWNRHR